MSILVFLNVHQGVLKKNSLEIATWGRKIAAQTGAEVSGIFFSKDKSESPDNFSASGLGKIFRMGGVDPLLTPDYVLCHALKEFVQKHNFQVILFPFDALGKSLAPTLAAGMKAVYVSGVSEIGTVQGDTWQVRKDIFSGKAHVWYEVSGTNKVFSFMPNSVDIESVNVQPVLEDVSVTLPSCSFQVKEVRKTSEGNSVPLPEAERVVSGGRGLKGPENWHLVEELARELNAATACSRPVADMHWRPHHEHVGQTGLSIRPNLYIAIGISGAIQHLAGVNGSKTIVVINNDKEAPFFKSADYGVVGDAFSVVPKLINSIRKLKENNA